MMRISIVGGGLAGSALAAILDPSRFDVTVHEEHPERLGLGTALGMWPPAQRAVRRTGAGGVLDEAAGIGGAALYDLTGTPLVVPGRTVEPFRLVGRAELARALSQAVPSSVRRVSGAVDDPSTLDADLVVGADGVHSAVRRWAWGLGASSRATPFLAVRGLVPQRSDGFGEYWGAGRLFGITPVSGDATNWFSAYRSDLGPRSVAVGKALDDARRRFADAAPPVRGVLADATPETSLAQRIWVTPPLRCYVRGRVVLVGDAAHAMMPNLGRGACESLVDAHVLGAALNAGDPHDPAGALRRYDARRVVPSQVVRLGSAAVARVALTRRLAASRDAALRLAGRVA